MPQRSGCCGKGLTTEEKSDILNRQTTPHTSNTYQILVIGDPSVGKSTLSLRLDGKDFDPQRTETIGVDYWLLVYSYRVVNGGSEWHTANFKLWDTAGQERFQTIVTNYYRNADAALVVYDLTRPETLSNIKQIWLPQLRTHGRNVKQILVLANKVDEYQKAE